MDSTDTLLTILVALLVIIILGFIAVGVTIFIVVRKMLKKLDHATSAANNAALLTALGIGKKLGLLRILRLIIFKR